MKLAYLSAVVIAAGLLSACQTPAAAAPAQVYRHPIEQYLEFAPGADDWVRTELYFGFSHDGKVVVSEDTWQQFLHDEVTPRFPDGFTVVPARGQWQNGKGVVELEETRILVLFTPPAPGANQKIEAIRAAFLQKFGEDSVLRVTSPSKVAF
jgi:hypothetical protein